MEDEGVKGVIFVKEFRSCCLNSCKQHALKGQKLLAQGNALGYHVRKLGALKGKSFKTHTEIYKAFALTGRQICVQNNPGRCPGLRASALYLSATRR